MMSTVHTPYNLEMSDNCLNCQLRGRGFFCQFAGEELRGLAAVSYSTVYPENSVLFVEGQMPRGVYILCRGRAKLSMVSSEGKTLILHISEPGDILGLSSCLLSQPYPLSAELHPPRGFSAVHTQPSPGHVPGGRVPEPRVPRRLQ
jgi:CRP/FNR family transcriptional regulator